MTGKARGKARRRRIRRTRQRAYYDKKVDVLSIVLRKGKLRRAVVVRGTVVIFADDRGIYAIDIEAEKWDTDDVDRELKLMNVDFL